MDWPTGVGFETLVAGPVVGSHPIHEEDTMGKTGRKRRARKKKAANHGKRPNT